MWGRDDMGLVLAFETASRPEPRAPRRIEPSQSAEILFFTGVRYERNVADGSATARQPDAPESGMPAS